MLFALLGGHPSPVLVDAVLPVEDGLEADLRGDRLHVQNDVLKMENRDRDEAQWIIYFMVRLYFSFLF